MNRALRLLVASTLLLAPVAGSAQERLEERPAPFPWGDQTKFVTVPARALSSPVAQAGFMAGALACLPGTLYQEARRHGEVPFDQQPSIVCGRALSTALGWPVYTAIGLPFYVLQTLFWTAPRAVIGAGKKK